MPPELDELVLACLAKQPEQRPADAGELRARLAALGVAERLTRERAEQWWDAHLPGAEASTDREGSRDDGLCLACT